MLDVKKPSCIYSSINEMTVHRYMYVRRIKGYRDHVPCPKLVIYRERVSALEENITQCYVLITCKALETVYVYYNT